MKWRKSKEESSEEPRSYFVIYWLAIGLTLVAVGVHEVVTQETLIDLGKLATDDFSYEVEATGTAAAIAGAGTIALGVGFLLGAFARGYLRKQGPPYGMFFLGFVVFIICHVAGTIMGK